MVYDFQNLKEKKIKSKTKINKQKNDFIVIDNDSE